ncbi:RICIN domain-containing protein, partial [Ohtaekwangia sp.]|uniref:RICIN domain-containing protein n=1 Tax=Ohtaekwangia sp. TaxID=2066019 RepID=UPI002FDEB0D5
TSSLENTVSAYSSINENADSLTVIVVNRDMSASRSVTINLNNFNVANGSYQTLQLASLPATETFVSHTQNALKSNTVQVNSNSFTISAPSLSTTAILLVKARGVTYVSLANRATGLYLDGMYRSDNGSNAGQWSNSGSTAQQWSIETVGDYIMLKNRATGLYLDGMYRSDNGSNAGQWGSSGSTAQQWSVETVEGYVKLKNRATGLYVDGMGRTTNGSDLGQWAQSTSPNQQWSMSTIGTARQSSPEESANTTEEFAVKLYPNPFAKTITLDVQGTDEQLKITVLDATGNEVEAMIHSGGSAKLSLGAMLKPGLYIIRVNGVKTSRSFKVFKE